MGKSSQFCSVHQLKQQDQLLYSTFCRPQTFFEFLLSASNHTFGRDHFKFRVCNIILTWSKTIVSFMKKHGKLESYPRIQGQVVLKTVLHMLLPCSMSQIISHCLYNKYIIYSMSLFNEIKIGQCQDIGKIPYVMSS